jgi:hypothetical protein
MAEGWVDPSGREGDTIPPRSRGFTRLVLGVLFGVAFLDVLLHVLGMSGTRGFRHLGVAAALLILGAIAWEPVARHSGRMDKPTILAWLGFPLASLLALASIPFLAMSLFPGLEGTIFRAEARVDEASGALELVFPLPVASGGINLKLGLAEVPDSYVRAHADAFRWTGPTTLRVDLPRVLRDLATRRPAEIEINAIAGAPFFRYETGDAVPEQKVPLR